MNNLPEFPFPSCAHITRSRAEPSASMSNNILKPNQIKPGIVREGVSARSGTWDKLSCD